MSLRRSYARVSRSVAYKRCLDRIQYVLQGCAGVITEESNPGPAY